MDGPIKNYHRFYASWRRLAHRDEESEKDAVVSQYTSGRTTHLSEMRKKEYTNLCKAIENMCGYGDQRRRQRSIALHLMQDIGVDTKDWQRINDFCRHPRICGKVFGLLSVEELEALQLKLRAIQRKGGLKEEHANLTDFTDSENHHQVQQIKVITYGTRENQQGIGGPTGGFFGSSLPS